MVAQGIATSGSRRSLEGGMTFLSPPFFCDSVLSHSGLDGKRFFCMFSTFVLTTFVDNLKTLSSYSTHLDLFSFRSVLCERDEEQVATRVQLCSSVNTARISITCALYISRDEVCSISGAQRRTGRFCGRKGRGPMRHCGDSRAVTW